MVDHALLLKDLQGQVKLLEQDLRERSEDPTAIAGTGPDGTPETFAEALDREYQRARKAERTDATYGAWRDDQVTQAAVAWVLATVFVRFCEDNGLLEYPFIAGPRDGDDRYAQAMEFRDAWILEGRRENPDAPERTDRDWLEHAFAEMSVSSVMAGLFSREYNPMWKITPSHQAAQALIDFWRTVGDDGHLVHDFRDPEWNTRFLGDLYQDLSEATRKKYALLQTPEFVEEFILDYTLEPAVEEFGLDGKRIYQEDDQGFRLIDPTCGSGHFLLGAFHRLLKKWREAEPGASDWDLISRALRSVHGVDKNPYAVAIARFRLMIAAMREGGVEHLSESNPEWPIVVAAGDSLIHGRGAPGERKDLFDEVAVHIYTTEDVYRFVGSNDLLGVASYHVVAGNPPYITVKDKKEGDAYRNRYGSCSGAFALSVPFAERFFDLAKRAGGKQMGAGFVGQITANSFMKREFGKKLIEEVFRNKVRLTHVIDASGAYIPGHGTPTVILLGRNEFNSHKSTVHALLGIRGEPTEPRDPARGNVWRAIEAQISSEKSESEWIASRKLPWEAFKSHPWNLNGGRAAEIFEKLSESSLRLGEVVDVIGRTTHTGLDDAFYCPESSLRTRGLDQKSVSIVVGDRVRDYTIHQPDKSMFPYDSQGNSRSLETEEAKFYWRNKTLLRSRIDFGATPEERGLRWFDHSMFFPKRYRVDLSIAFAFVATHNHFVLDYGARVFNRTAPAIKLAEGKSEEEHLRLLAVLNSSAGCFWLKQISQSKGNGGIGGGISDELWEHRFEFSARGVRDFPIPDSLSSQISSRLSFGGDQLARYPSQLRSHPSPTGEVIDCLRQSYTSTFGRMVALQEELDWDHYYRYGLIENEVQGVLARNVDELPVVYPGQRAFEIILARKMRNEEVSTEWFDRHDMTVTTEIPSEWPDWYQRIVRQRINVIEENHFVRFIERPEYKRRWHGEPWGEKQREALKGWLLDKCEDRHIWFYVDDYGASRPKLTSLRGLANRVRDIFPGAVEVAALYSPDKDFSAVIEEITGLEHVPYLAALRYKEAGLRKCADWEHVWDLQRQEDQFNANLEEDEEEQRLDIPIPPKYISADFRKPSFWRNRGKLDVPKERFISYEGAEADEDPTLILGWAGWDHAEQADALASLAFERVEQGWRDDAEKMTPLLAGIAELLPWVRQWHSEPDEAGESPADIVEEDLKQLREETGITDSDMQNWRPTASGRGKRKKK